MWTLTRNLDTPTIIKLNGKTDFRRLMLRLLTAYDFFKETFFKCVEYNVE
jgi:hypothetical protein